VEVRLVSPGEREIGVERSQMTACDRDHCWQSSILEPTAPVLV
jgi:hypothetical protein